MIIWILSFYYLGIFLDVNLLLVLSLFFIADKINSVIYYNL